MHSWIAAQEHHRYRTLSTTRNRKTSEIEANSIRKLCAFSALYQLAFPFISSHTSKAMSFAFSPHNFIGKSPKPPKRIFDSPPPGVPRAKPAFDTPPQRRPKTPINKQKVVDTRAEERRGRICRTIEKKSVCVSSVAPLPQKTVRYAPPAKAYNMRHRPYRQKKKPNSPVVLVFK